ncbi:MAG: hypothetical protein DKINENOH_00853 [bacterium]|nr:hypothetical protein [bacterium]
MKTTCELFGHVRLQFLNQMSLTFQPGHLGYRKLSQLALILLLTVVTSSWAQTPWRSIPKESLVKEQFVRLKERERWLIGTPSTQVSGRVTDLAQFLPSGAATPITLQDPTPETGAFFGDAVLLADVNGDGHADAVVGSPYVDVGGLQNVGQVFVYLGPTYSAAPLVLDDPMPVFIAYFGATLAAGDVNGDGYDDLLVGTPWSDIGSIYAAGHVFVFLGGPSFDRTRDFTLQDPFPESYASFGTAVATGDLNGDGIDDVVVGGDESDASGLTSAGEAFVFLGSNPFDSSSDFTLRDPAPEAYANFGTAVVLANLNGDTKKDVIISAPFSDIGSVVSAGQAFVFMGGTNFDTNADFTLQDPSPQNLMAFGLSITAGEVNGDSFEDVITGSYGRGPASATGEEATVYFGAQSFNTTIDAVLRNPTPEAGVRFAPALACGDLNSDNIDDVVMGIFGRNFNGLERSGQAFVFRGSASFDVNVDGTVEDPSPEFQANFGKAVAVAKSKGEILVGARGAALFSSGQRDFFGATEQNTVLQFSLSSSGTSIIAFSISFIGFNASFTQAATWTTNYPSLAVVNNQVNYTTSTDTLRATFVTPNRLEGTVSSRRTSSGQLYRTGVLKFFAKLGGFAGEAFVFPNETSPSPATIRLTPASFQFTATQGGNNPAAQVLVIGNSGVSGSTLNWSATDNANWLSLSPTSGSVVAGGNQNATLSVNTTGMVAGTYNATITVTDPNATNSPQTASVMLTIQALSRPTIALYPTTFQFTAVQGGSSPTSQTMNVSNTGLSGSTLNWSATDNASWLSLSLVGGTIPAGSSHNTSLAVNLTGLTAGTYNATVTVTDPNATNSPQTASVTLIVQPPSPKPTITLNTTTFQFTATQDGNNPAAQALVIGNSGASGSTLIWSATDNANWLSLSPTSGSVVAGGNQNVTLSISITGLATGTHNATITVTDPQATNNFQRVAITLTITPDGSYFVDTGITLTPMRSGAGCWGDYDNDGDLDILMTGRRDNNYYAMIYRNNGNGAFTNINAGLAPVAYGNASWADYDNDGDLDILLAGWDNTKDLLHVYKNIGNGSFAKLSQELIPVGYMDAEWGDLDNDGELDIVVSGLENNTTPVVYLYVNTRNDSFTFMRLSLATPVYDGSVTVGDTDNDGDMDLLLTGQRESKIFTLLYRNDGNLQFLLVNSSLRGVYSSGSLARFGDYDGDGDLDIALMGNDMSGNFYTMIYRNLGNNSFAEVNAGLANQKDGNLSWGDYDNDGDLDLLVSGFDGRNDNVRLYRNDGNNRFTRVNDGFVEATGPCQWGDYDNDGDLDILLIGWDGNGTAHFAKIYRNENTSANSKPAAPTNLRSLFVNGVLTVWCDAATDRETPAQGLTYNLRVGVSPGGQEIMAGNANGTGWRMIPAWGNVQHNKSWVLRGLDPNLRIHWAVQAVDGCFAGSPWAVAEASTAVDEHPAGVSLQYSLQQNYPNPFNPMTRIEFTLPEPAHVRLLVHDLSGRLIRVLLDEACDTGYHRVEWDGDDMRGQRAASGVYLCKFQANKYEATRKMILVQ